MPSEDIQGSAIISSCGKYRYALSRIWNTDKPVVLWLMLNPSTADASENDATIRRCIGFSKEWGFGGLLVGNVYAYRTKNPKELKAAGYPIGEATYNHLGFLARGATTVVCAWGTHARQENAESALAHIRAACRRDVVFKCLGHNDDCSPKHPLFLAKDTPLRDYLPNKL